MTDKDFCKIETAISGEEIDKVEQLTHCSFTGRELKEYLEQAFVIYGVVVLKGTLSCDCPICNKEMFSQVVKHHFCKDCNEHFTTT
tara:strand:+ start:1985 stop:2242 length:258 start_codon:yes stop_codon:yes gene_type:complete